MAGPAEQHACPPGPRLRLRGFAGPAFDPPCCRRCGRRLPLAPGPSPSTLTSRRLLMTVSRRPPAVPPLSKAPTPPGSGCIRRRLILAALPLVAFAPGYPAAAESTPTAAPRSEPGDPRDAIGRALDFTVTVEADGVYGAGIVVAPAAGLVLTAQHVVEPMRAPVVTFRDGRRLPARLVEVDRALDVALLRVEPQPSTPPQIGRVAALRPGEEVFAVGCPRHLGFTVSRGIVSYVGRELDGGRWLQTDLPINDGNSGGPVINARGELVGMMSFILRGAQGMSFALPVDVALARFRQLAATAPSAGGARADRPAPPALRPAAPSRPAR